MALGRPLREVAEMSAAEFAFWIEYRRRRGFPADRIEAVTAIAAAANVRVHGAKDVKPVDFLPKFGDTKSGSTKGQMRAWLSGIPGVKIRRIPKRGEPHDITPPPPKPARQPRRNLSHGRQ